MSVRTWEGHGSLVSFVVSLNLRRRHLTTAQRALLGVELLPYLEAEAHARQVAALKQGAGAVRQKFDERDGGRALDHAAGATGSNRQYVADARRITQWAPEVADAMRRGVVPTMHVARAVAAMPADARRVALAEIERLGPRDVTVSAVKRAAAAYLQSAAPPSPQPPVGRYPVVYADPPWRYEDGTTSPNRFIENHYPTMALEDICALPVAEWAAPDAVLFLWATSPKLEEALQVMRAWGFQYRSHAVWAKDTMGMGYLFRQQHELLLVGRRGAMPAPQPAARVSSLIHAPRREHSAKPDKVYDLIDAMYPSLRKVELFARHQRGGLWTSWGNEDLVA